MPSSCPRCGGFLRTLDQIDGWSSIVCINCGLTHDIVCPIPPAALSGDRSRIGGGRAEEVTRVLRFPPTPVWGVVASRAIP